jgi:plastocyanin
MSQQNSSRALSRRALMVALGAAGAALAACSAGRTVTVDIRNMAYGPAPSDLKVGDSVVWKNDDIFQHTATAADGSFDLDVKPGEEARATLTKAGQVEVYCRYHPGMKLTLNVAA